MHPTPLKIENLFGRYSNVGGPRRIEGMTVANKQNALKYTFPLFVVEFGQDISLL
jgi:hypothetical protein